MYIFLKLQTAVVHSCNLFLRISLSLASWKQQSLIHSELTGKISFSSDNQTPYKWHKSEICQFHFPSHGFLFVLTMNMQPDWTNLHRIGVDLAGVSSLVRGLHVANVQIPFLHIWSLQANPFISYDSTIFKCQQFVSVV